MVDLVRDGHRFGVVEAITTDNGYPVAVELYADDEDYAWVFDLTVEEARTLANALNVVAADAAYNE